MYKILVSALKFRMLQSALEQLRADQTSVSRWTESVGGGGGVTKEFCKRLVGQWQVLWSTKCLWDMRTLSTKKAESQSMLNHTVQDIGGCTSVDMWLNWLLGDCSNTPWLFMTQNLTKNNEFRLNNTNFN